MDAKVAQPLQRVRQFQGREGSAGVPMGYIAVLAIDTAERTAGKEDRTGSAGAGDWRFFPEMRRRPGDEHMIPETTEAGFCRAVSTAAAGTEGAMGEFTIHHSQFIIRSAFCSDTRKMQNRSSRIRARISQLIVAF
jgi:hypothetical protein